MCTEFLVPSLVYELEQNTRQQSMESGNPTSLRRACMTQPGRMGVLASHKANFALIRITHAMYLDKNSLLSSLLWAALRQASLEQSARSIPHTVWQLGHLLCLSATHHKTAASMCHFSLFHIFLQCSPPPPPLLTGAAPHLHFANKKSAFFILASSSAF